MVYLDAKSDTYLEEVSSCNIFVVKGKSIKTPPLSGTILPGVTRKSIIDLARMRGYTVSEEPVSVTEALAADEVFTTGTAVVLAPVGSITYKGNKRQYGKEGEVGSTAMEMYNALTRLQAEEEPDPFSPPWVVPAFK